jgi:hypothetical protein
MAFLESLRLVLTWRLDHYVRRGALTCNNKRKRIDILHWNGVSNITHLYQISSEGFLFRRGEILLAFGFIFDRGQAMCAVPQGSARDIVAF